MQVEAFGPQRRGWMQRALSTVIGRGPPMPEVKASRTAPLIAIDGNRAPQWAPRDYATFAREGLMQNPVAYRSVRMIAEAAASVPLLLYDRDTEIDDHPLLDLLRTPAPGQTNVDLFEAVFSALLISGNAFIEAVAAHDEVRELYVLRSDRMQVVPGQTGWSGGYLYTAGGQSITLEGDAIVGVPRILHMRLYHPLNDHYGLSPFEAAATAIDIHNEAAKWNKSLLDNSARPSGALVYGASESMSPAQFARLKSELEESFQGARNAGRPLLLEGGLDWKAMSLSPRDMDFISLKQMAAREIALALGVPPLLLGLPGDNTYSNYQEANRTFWRQTVIPLSIRTAKALSGWLGAGLVLRPDLDQLDALAPDREALWARLDGASFLTDDEKRAEAGYGPRADGDRLVAKSNPYHAADGQFDFAPDGDSDGIQPAQIGGEREYSVDLKQEEVRGGHTIRDHVGKTDTDLLGVVERSVTRTPFVTIAKKSQSSFDSVEAANDFVNRLLEQNTDKVDAVANGAARDAWLERRFGYPTGREAFRANADAEPYMRPTYNAGAYIVHDPASARGFRVHTAYPTNDNTR